MLKQILDRVINSNKDDCHEHFTPVRKMENLAKLVSPYLEHMSGTSSLPCLFVLVLE